MYCKQFKDLHHFISKIVLVTPTFPNRETYLVNFLPAKMQLQYGSLFNQISDHSFSHIGAI